MSLIFYSTFVNSIIAYLLYKNKYDFFQNNTILDPETPPIQTDRPVYNNYEMDPIMNGNIVNIANNNNNNNNKIDKNRTEYYIKLAIGIISIFSSRKINNVNISEGISRSGGLLLFETYINNVV